MALPKNKNYDYNGRLTRSVDPLGNASQSFYTNDGRLTKTRSAGGGESRYGYYSAPGRQHLLYNTQQVIDEGDPQDPLDDIVAETTFAYDANGRMIATIDPNGQGSGFDYDLDGRVTQSRYTWVDPAGIETPKVIATGTVYDWDGRVTSTSQTVDQQLVSTSATAYTPTGQVQSSTDRFGHVSSTRYDLRGQGVESRTPTTDETGAPVVVVTRTAHDASGRAIASTDPFIENVTPTADIRVTHTIYDALGRVTETRRIAGVPITLIDDSANHNADPGTIWASSFDTNYTSGAILSSSSTQYDSAGRVFSTTSATGATSWNVYDELGRAYQSVQSIDLDQNGSLDAADTDSDGIPDTGSEVLISTSEFDEAGRVIRSTGPAGHVSEQTYDDAGRVIQSTMLGDVSTGDITTQSVYDPAGRRIAAIDPLGRQTDYAYDPTGRLTSVTLPAVLDGDPNSPTFNTSANPTYAYEYDPSGFDAFGADDPRDDLMLEGSDPDLNPRNPQGSRINRKRGCSTWNIFLTGQSLRRHVDVRASVGRVGAAGDGVGKLAGDILRLVGPFHGGVGGL